MEPVTTAAVINASATLGVKLIEARSKTNYSWLEGQRAKAANAKKTEDIRAIYDETISEFQQANADLENIARGYKELYEQIAISDEDIEFLNTTLSKVLEFAGKTGGIQDQQAELLNSVISLITKDMLKSMQLLGFNYREAIGIPLTEACSSYIENRLSPKSSNNRSSNQNKGKR